MDAILVGPGRAGLALGLAMRSAGHEFAAVLAREPEAAAEAAAALASAPAGWDQLLPAADLMVVAVRDDAIAEVATRLAPHAGAVTATVHLSGLVPVTALDPLPGLHGSFHPLQTLPAPDVGAAAIAGCWIAVTAAESELHQLLAELAHSLGAHPFDLADGAKALYHAGAAAASNFVVAALAVAEDLLDRAGVPLDHAAPLVRAVVANALTLGPAAALTGPIARGDIRTVEAQLDAVDAWAPEAAADYRAMGRAVARLAGRSGDMEALLS